MPLKLRLPWLPWAVAVCLALVAGWLGFDRYRFLLVVNAFRLRDHSQQRALDNAQTGEIALQRRLDDAIFHLTVSGKEKADLQAQLDDLKKQDPLSQIRIAVLASLLDGAPRAMAIVAWDGGKQRGFIKPANLPAPGADEDYQLWIIDPARKQQPASAGVFDSGTGARFEPAQPVSNAEKFAVTVERKGGVPAPQNPFILLGE